MMFGRNGQSTVNLLRRMLQKGVIKGKRLNGRWYITQTEIERITDEPANIPSDT